MIIENNPELEEDDFVDRPDACLIDLINESSQETTSLVHSVFIKEESLDVVVYRQSVVPFLAWLKLHSPLNYSNPVDIAVSDNLSCEFRFTIRYIVQSIINNNTVFVVTKTNEVLSITTTQNLFPAFN